MVVPAQSLLLRNQHRDKGFLVAAFLQVLEHRFLGLRHRTPDAMAAAFELANIDAGTWNFAHISASQNGTRPASVRAIP